MIAFIDKFFNIRKNGTMDAYLTDMKEAADQMEEVEVGLLEKVIVYHTLKNLPSDYDTFILHKRKSPTFLELEARLLNEELGRRNSGQEQPKALAATIRGTNSCRPYNC